MNLEYLDKVQQSISPEDRSRMESYLLGALSVLTEEDKWRQLCDQSIAYLELRKTGVPNGQ